MINEPESPSIQRGFRVQTSLLTLLLLIALAAIFLANFRARVQASHLKAQLPGLRNMVRELWVEDPSKFYAVAHQQQWYDENIADIHVPPGGPYEVCLAVDKVGPSGFPQPEVCSPISEGTHSLQFHYDRSEDESVFTVDLDGEVALQAFRPQGWEAGRGSAGAIPFSQCMVLEDGPPWVLFRKRFMVPSQSNGWSTPQVAGPGYLVWVQAKEMSSTVKE